ncbi:MAG TPA: TolC family protein [Bryobacteraceae bacterium]|nr:TolC family protein [Bryobacteraceae bacterium]
MALRKALTAAALGLLTLTAQQQFRLPKQRPITNRLSELSPAEQSNSLTLATLVESLNRHFPPLRAALLERPLAEADLLSAQGKFDLVLKSRLDTQQFGYYENERFSVNIEQPTQVWGTTLYSGYALSTGRYPSYDGKQLTNDGGQYIAGIRVPLARDREIDGRRADLMQKRIGLRLADLSIDQQRIAILQSATRRYWDWVSAGRRLAIARSLLEVAQSRDSILREAVRLGGLPQFEQLDNQRLVLQRQNNIVEAQRAIENAAIELSLYLRDAEGRPRLAVNTELPPAFPDPAPPTDAEIAADLDAAVLRRPDILRIVFQRNQVEVDRKLAINQRKPGIDVFTEYGREMGSGTVLRGPNDVRAGVLFDLPFQRRQATGKLQAAEAKIRQYEQRETYQRDQATAEVKDAASAVKAAFQRAQVLHEELKITRQVEEAERTRYELGDSTLFVLNQREQSTAEAAIREANALADYFRAYAAYELAIARGLTAASPTP